MLTVCKAPRSREDSQQASLENEEANGENVDNGVDLDQVRTASEVCDPLLTSNVAASVIAATAWPHRASIPVLNRGPFVALVVDHAIGLYCY